MLKNQSNRKDEIDDEWFNLTKKYDYYILEKQEEIVEKLNMILKKTINNFDFIFLHRTYMQFSWQEEILISNFENAFSIIYESTKDLNLYKSLIDFKINLSKFPDNNIYQEYKNSFDLNISSEFNKDELEKAFQTFLENLNVNQKILFDSNLQSLKNAFNKIFSDKKNIEDDPCFQSFKLVKENLSNNETMRNIALKAEVKQKMEKMLEPCWNLLQYEINKTIKPHSQVKFLALQTLTEVFYLPYKYKVQNILSTFVILVFCILLSFKIVLLVTLIRARSEIRYSKTLISMYYYAFCSYFT